MNRQNLIKILDRFEDVQASHLYRISRGKLKDIALWHVERQEAFNRIREITRVIEKENKVAPDRELQRLMRERLKLIVDKEALLLAAVMRQMEKIKQGLSVLRVGKKSLSGYSQGSNNAVNPRFLSSRT